MSSCADGVKSLIGTYATVASVSRAGIEVAKPFSQAAVGLNKMLAPAHVVSLIQAPFEVTWV